MFNQKNILILTSKTGGGHLSLAEALRDLIENDGQSASVKDEAALQQTNAPVITIADPQPGFVHLHYRLVSRYALPLWAAEFRFLDTPQRALLIHRLFTGVVRHQLKRLLDDLQPDLILTTYPFLSYEVRQTLEQCASQVPLVLFLSDANGVHASWLSERRATAILAPTRETYAQALAAGFAPERVHLVGWPVRSQFLHASQASQETRMQLLAHLQLAPHRFTIFLQGGGEGAAHIDRTLENIAASSVLTSDVQVILAAGTNAALQERYKHMRNLAILPSTPEIAPYMAAADLIMGKAGPNVLFESVMLGKPFMATTFIPGQEQANLSFIQRYSLGWVAMQPEEQQSLLTALVHDAHQFSRVLATIDAYRRWNAEMTQCIGLHMHSLLADEQPRTTKGGAALQLHY
jgi:UDP-N-acetylglucosamine:LPS N-acetylglucosamine transferase